MSWFWFSSIPVLVLGCTSLYKLRRQYGGIFLWNLQILRRWCKLTTISNWITVPRNLKKKYLVKSLFPLVLLIYQSFSRNDLDSDLVVGVWSYMVLVVPPFLKHAFSFIPCRLIKGNFIVMIVGSAG